MSLAAGDEYVITFVNYNKGADGTNYWANWAFISDVFSCRADHGTSNPYWGTATNVNFTGSSWTDISETINEWLQAYNGVTVTLTVSRNAAGTGITVSHSATTNAVASITSQTYAGTFTATVGAEASINFYLTVENAHLNITKVVHTDASGNTTYSYNASESAYVDSSNGTTNYNGSSVSQLQINNTQYRNWSSGSDGSVKFNSGGKVALYKFDLSEIKSLSNITTISFTVVGISSDTKATSPVWLLGYNPEWSASTITYNSGFTNNGDKETLTGTVSGKGSFQPLNDTGTYTVNGSGSGYTTMSANAKTYVESAIDADKDYVSFGLAVNLGRVAYLNVGADLTISCSASVVYTATFTEANSLNPTVTIYSDEGMTSPVTNGTLTNGTKYYYKAVLYGYNDVTGNFTVSGANPSINFTMTAKSTFTYTKRAICGSDVLNATLATKTDYEGETITLSWSKYIKVGEQWYVATGNTYQSSSTVSATEDVEYSLSDIADFYEMESLTRNGGAYLTETSGSYSAGARLRLSKGSLYYTPALTGGVYTLSIPWVNGNSSVNEVYVYTRTSGGVLSEKLVTFTATGSSSGTFTATITVPEGYSIAFDGNEGGSANNNARMDYMTLTPYKESKPITAAGWATYCSPYALDLANATGLTDAYIVTGGAGGVLAKTSVKGGTVAAGTGLLLKGSAGTVTIPVVASGTDYSATNKLVGVTANTEIDAEAGYVLMNDATNGLGFYLNSNAFTVGANTAYLPANFDATSARGFFALDGDATGISTIAKSQEPNANSYYDLQGRRVAQPTKGLYIKDGKKVIVK